MNTPNRLLLTIVCEAVLEPFLEEELPHLGVTGYTITDARGLGTHGRRTGAWRKEGNIRVDILCDPGLAERVAEHLRREYEANYGLLIFSSPVQVHSA
ncbi:MAG: transcriptional regulator [Thiobacillus sp.]|nr:transcriptional regulator [Thiobacillus sp.]